MYLFCTLFCASSITISVISKLNAFWTFLFFIFDTPNSKILGILSIPLFINFFPNLELKAFVPRSKPALTRFDPSPFPNYANFASILLLAFIFLNAGAAKFR